MGKRLSVSVLALMILGAWGCSYTIHNPGVDGGTSPSTSGGGTGDPNGGTGSGSGTGSTSSNSPTYCSDYSTGGGCTCFFSGGEGTSTRCSTTSVKNGICCADSNWPYGGQCTCGSFACSSPTNPTDGCTCSVGSSGAGTTLPASSCFPSDKYVCCATESYSGPGSCTCDTTECVTGQTPVNSCTPLQIKCGAGQTIVTSCSTNP